MKTLQERLKAKHACSEAMEWLGDKPLQEAWETCPRADWLLWAYARLCPDKKRELSSAKGHCASTVRHLMKDARSIAAVDVAIAYGEGKATEQELKDAAYAAYVAYAAVDAAVDAAAAYAAYAAADTVAYAAAALSDMADICRKYLVLPDADLQSSE